MVNKEQAILAALTVYLSLTQAIVQFNFSRGDFAISEGGDLPSQLSIIKTGQNVMDISFQVQVIPDSARDSSDYTSNSGDSYVFTSNTSQLPIKTRLVGDRAGEPIERFMICLPDAQVLQPMGAEAIEPTCVTITIVDDDSVVIGFKNSFEAVVEGRIRMVCAEVKSEGLRLDPFDRVPLIIRINPVSNEVQLSTSSLLFEMSISEGCVTVTVADSDNVNLDSRSYDLIIERSREMSTVPVEIYPNTIPLRVIDNDAPDANFSIISTQSVFTVREGDRIDSVRVQKFGTTFLDYNVSLMIITLRGSSDPNDIAVNGSLLFNPSVTIVNVGAIEIVNNSLSEGTKEFNISIGGIKAVGVPGVPTNVLGNPVKIIVYDNDFKVGFNSSNITLVEGTNDTVCMSVLELEPSDINPARNISLLISTNNTSSEPGNLEISDSEVFLNNGNNYTGCFIVTYPDDNNECDMKGARNFIIQLTWIRPNNPDYSIYFERKKVNVTIIDNSQDCLITGSGFNRTAAIVVPIVLALGLSIIVITVALAVIVWRRLKCVEDESKNQGNNGERKSEAVTKEPSSSSQFQSKVEKKEEIKYSKESASPYHGKNNLKSSAESHKVEINVSGTPKEPAPPGDGEELKDLTSSHKGEIKENGTPADAPKKPTVTSDII